jgi:hypothetical protein
MKVAYIFLSLGVGLHRLVSTILPELEEDIHPLDVVGMCFFDSNAVVLDPRNSIGQRLIRLGKEKNIILMKGDESDLLIKSLNGGHKSPLPKGNRRTPAECAVITVADGKQVACFPDLYTALADNKPERIISL